MAEPTVPSARRLVPDCRVKYLDPSLNAGDVNLLLQGFGSLCFDDGALLPTERTYSSTTAREIERRIGMSSTIQLQTGRSGMLVGPRSDVPGIDNVDFLALSVDLAQDFKRTLLVGQGLVRAQVNKPLVHAWSERLHDLIFRYSLTRDFTVWPLIALDPKSIMERMVWSLVRDPNNEFLARVLLRSRRKHTRVSTAYIPVVAVVDMDHARHTLTNR